MAQYKKQAKLTNHEISVFCAQMSMLIKGGIAPYEGVNILMQDTKDKQGQAILQQMLDIVNTGEKLYTAVEATGVFPDYVIHMIAIGELTGKLDTVLDALSEFYESEDSIRDTIRSALSYPLIMIILMFIVIMVMITRVLPIFSQVFSQLGTSMNTFSESLLNIGEQMNQSSLVIVIILALLTAFFLYLARTESGHRHFVQFMQNFTPTKSLTDDIATGRFASGMALTLASGMDTTQSLDLVRQLVENERISKKIVECQRLIQEESLSLPEALSEVHMFTQLYTRMLLVGYRSGSIDTVMRQIANQYEKHTSRRIYSLLAVIEPALIIILSIIVGLILLSIILPLMGIMSNIG